MIKNKKRFALIIISVVIITLFVGGFLVWFFWMLPCEIFPKAMRDGCYIGKIADGVIQPDLSFCEEKIQNREKREDCYYSAGSLKLDLSACDKIRNIETRAQCYTEIARGKHDISICDKIPDDLKGKISIDRDMCYINVASNKQDLPICDMIQDLETKEFCYAGVALEKLDISICDEKFQDLKRKEMCYLGVISSPRSTKLDISLCDTLLKDPENKDICYGNIAIGKGDRSICKKIQSPEVKNHCFSQVKWWSKWLK